MHSLTYTYNQYNQHNSSSAFFIFVFEKNLQAPSQDFGGVENKTPKCGPFGAKSWPFGPKLKKKTNKQTNKQKQNKQNKQKQKKNNNNICDKFADS